MAEAESGGDPPTLTELPKTWSKAEAPAPAGADDGIAKLQLLQRLLQDGHITATEFEMRRNALVDSLTGTRKKRRARTPVSDGATELLPQLPPLIEEDRGCPPVVPHTPRFAQFEPEEAVLHTFQLNSGRWTRERIPIKLDPVPFARGSLRLAYYLQDLRPSSTRPGEGSEEGGPEEEPQIFVAKLSIDPDEESATYFRDIELQEHCRRYAALYNSHHPPKKVEFLQAWVLELVQRGRVLTGLEAFMPGRYRKHNNNFGSVSDNERNTPQAFSHFTYEASQHRLLAVDIQGVGDKYTDPQIHTLKESEFGKGNLGPRGFQTFLESHRCNQVCSYLRLPPVNPREDATGTVPASNFMPNASISSERFDSKHYYESTPFLRQYLLEREGGSEPILEQSAQTPVCSCCVIL